MEHVQWAANGKIISLTRILNPAGVYAYNLAVAAEDIRKDYNWDDKKAFFPSLQKARTSFEPRTSGADL